MMLLRVMRYAEVQARTRARLGALPRPDQWHYISQAADLDNLIERMRANGLAYWLAELTRDPGPRAIQVHLNGRIRRFVAHYAVLLPAQWRAAVQWLELLPDLTPARLVLRDPQPDVALDVDSPLREVLTMALDQRAARLRASGNGLLVDAVRADTPWLDGFLNALAALRGHERRELRRLQRIVFAHVNTIAALRDTVRRAETDESGASVPPGPHAQWRAREELLVNLHRWLGAADPFHGSFILGYGLIEALQFERLRAMLLAYARRWGPEARIWEAR